MAKKPKSYSEGELIKMFNLQRFRGNNASPLLAKWLDTKTELAPYEDELLTKIHANATKNIEGWIEEELKIKFIMPILLLSHLDDTDVYSSFFERTIEATVDGHFLKTKTDYMLAKGSFGIHEQPYFHFQEYKPRRNPSGDSMGQLLEAMLIAQHHNKNTKPVYGCEVIGSIWRFVVIKDRIYYISQVYDCTAIDDLMHIIAVLRKFKVILETELLD